MVITEAPLAGLLVLQPKIFEDTRGYFFEAWNEQTFHKHNMNFTFVQDNQSLSKKNVVRGLHFQKPPFAQGKLVRVVSGSIIDVAVDIRRDSANYGKYFAIELTDVNNLMLWIPPGFAHGFSVTSEQSRVLYKCTSPYNTSSEMGIRYDDNEINIDWMVQDPIISQKDLELPLLKDLSSPF